MNRYLTVVFAVLIAATTTLADWRQFRGTNASGVSSDAKKLPQNWSAKNSLHWKVALPGRGLSNPVIAKGRIYVTASSGWKQNRLHVLCFEEATGKLLWERQFWATGATQSHTKTNMAAPTPVTDGENVYALFASFDLVALDKDGNLKWFRSLTGDYTTVGNNVGAAASPVLWKDTLLLAVENVGESFALAINAKTGQNRWRSPRSRVINWVTPQVIEQDGKAQAIFQSPSEISAYDLTTGKKLWKLAGEKFSTRASPVFADGLLYVQGKEFMALRPSGNAAPEVVWKSRKLNCGYATPLYYQGKIYTLTARGVLNCADAISGAPISSPRLQGDFAASPVAGDGKVYAVNEEGSTTVINVKDKPQVVSVNPIRDTILASPALANGAVYLRSDGFLYCFKNKQP